MTTTYTTAIRLPKQGTGDNNNTWGSILNTLFDLVDDAVSGATTISLTTATDITLTTNNGAADEARRMSLIMTGTPTVDINLIVPALVKFYVVDLQISGTKTVTIKTSSGTGVTLYPFASKSVHMFYCNGTNVYEVSVPQYTVSMWGGTIATIPGGYLLCNGSGGTPDLRDKFIVGAKQDDSGTAKTNVTGALTQTGGAASGTTSSDGAHTHTGATGSTILTIAQMPAHTHSVTFTNNIGANGTLQNAISGASSLATSSTGGSEGHTHTISSDGGHTHTVSTLPPYYALAFIMRI